MRFFQPRLGRPIRTSEPGLWPRPRRAAQRLLPAVTLLAVVCQILIAGPAQAKSGDLDRSFGTRGIAAIDFNARTVAVQGKDKLIAAGTAFDGTTNVGTFTLARFTRDGALDPTFGTGGTVSTGFTGYQTALLGALAVQADGKLVAAGTVRSSSTGPFGDVALARFKPDGTLDPTFGTGGTVTASFAGGPDDAQALVVQADGKLVIAGFANQDLNIDFGLARFNPDGTLDPTFGTGGTVITDFRGDPLGDRVSSLAVQADGKLVAAGTIGFRDKSVTEFALARYTADGTLDPTFGTDGKVITAFHNPSGTSFDNVLHALVLQPDGKLVAAGTSRTVPYRLDFALARYNPDGTLDPTFGTGGEVTTDFGFDLGDDQAFALALQPDGKLVATGRAVPENGAGIGLVRYNSDGTLDRSFGAAGKVTTAVASSGQALAIQPNGRLVVAGTVGGNASSVLVRYRG